MWGMPQKRVIPRRTPFDLGAAVDEYLHNRSLRERSEYHESKLKGDLMSYLETTGEIQEGGHRTLELDAPLEFVSYAKTTGRPIPKTVTGIERKRRASSTLNEDRTLALLKALDLLDECTEVIVVVDEDKILAANYEGRISDDDLKALYDESESFAFYLTTQQ
jgi:hypothetical protein